MTETVDTWTIAMESALACVPADLRLDVLRKLMDDETERRRHPFLFGWKKRSHAVIEATSVIVQVLVRDIANCHSKADAAAVLFRNHHGRGTGSCWLPDYLDGLPGIIVDRKLCIEQSSMKAEHVVV